VHNFYIEIHQLLP